MPFSDELYYQIHQGDPTGLRTPIVLIHGAGGNYLYWPSEIRRLPGFPVYALDLPGHGKSGGSGRASITAYATAVSTWLESLGLKQAVLVGHSMGSAIAVQLTLMIGEAVQGLVLMAGSARYHVNPALLESTRSPANFQQGVETIIQWSFGPRAPERLKELAARHMSATTPEVLHGDFLACQDFDPAGKLQDIKAPTLVLCGEADRMTPVNQARALAEKIPDARLEIIPGAGHMLMIEQPQRTASFLANFLLIFRYPDQEM